MPTPTQTRRITINVDTKGNQDLKALADQLGGVNKATKSLSDTFSQLKAAAASYLGVLGIRELASYSDQIQNLNNQLLGMTGSQEQATRLTAELGQLSRETNSSLSGTSDLYLKMARALGQANLSGTSLQEIMKVLVNSFRLSGSTAEEAYSATNSLALAFELGGLKGRELRTVLRQNQVLALALRKEFGAELFSAANNGFITVSKLVQVLYKNMGDINTRAGQMEATFGQTVTKVMDALAIKVFGVSQQLGGSNGFSQSMDLVIKNMNSMLTLGAILAASTLPAITTGLIKMGVAMTALSAQAVILTGGLGLGLAGVVAAFGNSSELPDLINQMRVGFSELKGDVLDFVAATVSGFSKLTFGEQRKLLEGTAKATRQAAQDAHVHAKALEIEYYNTKRLSEQQAKDADAAARHAGNLTKLSSAFKPDLDPKQLLAELNREFRSGALSVEEYNSKIQQVDLESARKKFRDGEFDLAKLNEASRKFSIYNLNQELKNGTITFTQFDNGIRNLKLDKLKEDLEAGRISVEDFNHSLASVQNNFSAKGAFRTGLQDYINSIGTTTQQVADTIKKAFGDVETYMLEFTKTGKFNFDKFTQGILDDLTRIIIRASIVQPLANGILSVLPTSAPSSGPSSVPQGGGGNYIVQPSAFGNVFDRGLVPYANGGIVSSPTIFAYGKGSAGLMGEAGPEAILPLKRGSGGSLGVAATVTPVHVNIINNNGSTVSQHETTGANGEKTIEVLIQNKVREGLAAGKFDKAFKQSYGLNRRGT